MTIGVLDKDGAPQTVSTIDDLMGGSTINDVATAIAAESVGVGTAGSPDPDVLTVQGASAMYPLSTAVESNTITVAGAPVTVKFAKGTASSSGNNAVVAAVTAKKIRVISYLVVASGAVNSKWQSDGAGTPADLTGLLYMAAAGGGAFGQWNPNGHFESASGKSLDLNLSGATAVGWNVSYIEV